MDLVKNAYFRGFSDHVRPAFVGECQLAVSRMLHRSSSTFVPSAALMLMSNVMLSGAEKSISIGQNVMRSGVGVGLFDLHSANHEEAGRSSDPDKTQLRRDVFHDEAIVCVSQNEIRKAFRNRQNANCQDRSSR